MQFPRFPFRRTSAASNAAASVSSTTSPPSAVIDTVGRTQPVPIVSGDDAGVPARDGDARPDDVDIALDAGLAPDTDAETDADADADAGLAPDADVETSAETGVDRAVAPSSVPAVPNTDAAAPAPAVDGRTHELEVTPTAVPATTPSLVGAEVIGGLRTAGRHLVQPSASEGHLRTELMITVRQLDAIAPTTDSDGDARWATAAAGLLDDARFALDEGRIADGWQLLRAARSEMLDGLDRRDLLVERADLSGGDLADDGVEIEALRSQVWTLRQTTNRYHAELDRRLEESGRSLRYRALMLLGALVLGAIGVLVTTPSSESSDALGGIGNYLTTAGLAMTGAAVSYVLFTRRSAHSSSISEVVNPLELVLLRVAFGGVIGVVIVVLLQSGVQDVVNASGQAAYFWAVLGGFSERLVDRTIDRLESNAYEAADAVRAS